MTSRRRTLDRLRNTFECDTAWETMAGDGCRRHCAACGRDVLDFAQLTAREAAAHLQASRGRLCARLTRRDGRLVLAPEVELPLPPVGPRLRAPALAATIVGAWLTASAAGAKSSEAPRVEAPAHADEAEREPRPRQQPATAAGGSATLRGRIREPLSADPLPGVMVVVRNTLDGGRHFAMTHADGTFALADLPGGVYDVEPTFEGFTIESRRGLLLRAGDEKEIELAGQVPRQEVTVTGATVAVAEPLRQLFRHSDLIVVAVAGPSETFERNEILARVDTELRIEAVVKGPAELRRIDYRHFEHPDMPPNPEKGEVDAYGELRPGHRVLAFRARSDEETAAPRPLFEAVDFASVKHLDDAELTAYLRRLEALLRLDERARRRGQGDPAEVADWLVATAEDPLTRGEAMEELATALDAVAEMAKDSATTADQQSAGRVAASLVELVDRFQGEGGRLENDPRPALIGAFLGDGERERLTAALVATEGLRVADLALFDLVRRWDEAAAVEWLAAHIGGTVANAEAWDVHYWLGIYAEESGNAALAAVLEAAEPLRDEIEALWPGDYTDETNALRSERLDVLYAGVRRDAAETIQSSAQTMVPSSP